MKRKPTAIYTFKTVPQEWRNCAVWASPSVEHLSVEERARFDRLEVAIKTYLENGSLKAAAEEGRCSKQTVIDKLNRCLTVNEDGSIAGWRGLLPYERLGRAPYRRRELPKGSRAGEQGAAGAFEAFLCAHEDIRTALHNAIRSGGSVKAKGKSHNPTLRGVFKAFNKACIAAGLTANDYPLNSKSKGRRSVERYVVAHIPTDPASVDIRGSRATTRVVPARAACLRPVDQAQRGRERNAHGMSARQALRGAVDAGAAPAHEPVAVADGRPSRGPRVGALRMEVIPRRPLVCPVLERGCGKAGGSP